ncbi:glutaredoxin family protein [Paraherbaspirillum soli]|uniref:Glutaredoxin family protein n=1 Tax=Paraherbaspirillum soli TaxID=631222 RepID=A0ABW0MDW8_9BURK
MSKHHFIIYSRSYCHLCDDMLEALHKLRAADGDGAHRFTVELIDVDADPELLAQYDEMVPVLLGSKDGQAAMQLCHYFLDVEKVKAFLRG